MTKTCDGVGAGAAVGLVVGAVVGAVVGVGEEPVDASAVGVELAPGCTAATWVGLG